MQHPLILLLAGLTSAAATSPQRFLFTFGDSYTTTSFNISSTKPSTSSPFGNPPYPGITTDSGANWVGYLIHSLAPPNTLSYNFAMSGATVNNSITDPNSWVLDFTQQTASFSANLVPAPSYAQWTAANSVFAAYFGTNDIVYAYQNETTQPSIFKEIMTTWFTNFATLYAAGARNFVAMNMDPLDRTPSFSTLPNAVVDQLLVKNAVNRWNQLLAQYASAFQNAHAGSKVTVFDDQGAFNPILDNPKMYGAPDNQCTNLDGTSCLWWNNEHPGQAIQQKGIGQGMYNVLHAQGFF